MVTRSAGPGPRANGRPALRRRLFDIDAGATVDSYPALAADGTLLVGAEGGELLAIAAG